MQHRPDAEGAINRQGAKVFYSHLQGESRKSCCALPPPGAETWSRTNLAPVADTSRPVLNIRMNVWASWSADLVLRLAWPSARSRGLQHLSPPTWSSRATIPARFNVLVDWWCSTEAGTGARGDHESPLPLNLRLSYPFYPFFIVKIIAFWQQILFVH